ncbi:MAG TPA: hypothetical protein VKW04_00845 [Planctomycetota bacterium]|nr:hypothetical protein [Planctomycetota bacterium]
MDKFCINHPEEKAVGTCGGCGALTCYRCSMNVDQVVYCSLGCFNQLNPPSSMTIKAAGVGGLDDTSGTMAGLADEYSDVMEAMVPRPAPGASALAQAPAPAPAPVTVPSAPASLEDPSVVLSAALADEASTMSFRKYRGPKGAGEDSTLVLIPGTRRSVLSSSCFFHPDTSAIVLCSECRNPICSLCARETAGGLACSPSCGPADPAREDDRKKDLLFTMALACGVLFVLGGGFMILRSAHFAQLRGAVPPLAQSAAASEGAPVELPVAAPAEAPTVAPPPPETPAAVAPPETPAAVPAFASFRPVLPPRVPLDPAVLADVDPALPDPLPAPAAGPAASQPVRPRLLPEYKPAPEPPRLSPYELDLRWATALLRDATPLVREVSLELGPEWRPGSDVPALSTKLNRAIVKLRQARELYVRHVSEAPDRAMLEDRISAIGETLKTAQEGFDRMGGVPQWRH